MIQPTFWILHIRDTDYYRYSTFQLLNIISNSLISFNHLRPQVLENIAYLGLGFATVFLALEAAWHFTACKIHDKSIKPCMFKQVKLALVSVQQIGNPDSGRTRKKMVQNDGKGGYRPIIMSTRILIVDDEPDANAALLERWNQVDSKLTLMNILPSLWRILSLIFNEELRRRIDEIINGTTTIQIRSK